MESDNSFKVSVIIPVYNAENSLAQAIQSATVFDEVHEIILVEDGSTDNSLEVCKSLAAKNSKIKVFQHPDLNNQGVSATRNLGIKKATCEFISFLDADDYYFENRFEKSKELFTKDKTIDGVYEAGGAIHESNPVYPYNRISTLDREIPYNELFFNLSPIGSSGALSTNSITLKKKAVIEVGCFDTSLKQSEDSLLWLKLAYSKKLVPGNIIKPVSNAIRHSNNLTNNPAEVWWYLIKMYEKLSQWGDLTFDKKTKFLIYNRLIYAHFNYGLVSKKNMAYIKLKLFLKHLLYSVSHPMLSLNKASLGVLKGIVFDWKGEKRNN